ncbi:GNAT family N-acetyltransferase [Clostridium sp.]|jgi:predicted acetyltransferase|uniref:GNAT family N-acetyltransferase n=1 Tax=Clostridium sp. TaxID=1506 RepID=UPI003EE86834
MNDLFLVEPRKEYQKSFENYVLAYRKTNDNCYLNIYNKGLENFDGYLNDLHNISKGIDLPQGWVTTSTFWLIDNNEVVGVVRIRHQEIECSGHIGYDISPCYRNKGYGTKILKLALGESEKIGIKDVIAACSIANIASKKIIEKNNGELLGIIFDEEDNENLYKYSIPTTNSRL